MTNDRHATLMNKPIPLRRLITMLAAYLLLVGMAAYFGLKQADASAREAEEANHALQVTMNNAARTAAGCEHFLGEQGDELSYWLKFKDGAYTRFPGDNDQSRQDAIHLFCAGNRQVRVEVVRTGYELQIQP